FVTRAWRIAAGAAAAFLVSILITLRLDPQSWTQYSQMLGYSGFETDPIPTLSVLLRTRLAPHFIVLQFVPVAVVCIWALIHYWKRRRSWNWPQDANLLL